MTYTTMISQCGTQQQLRRALELVAEMRSRGIQCNVHTYSALMNVCIKGEAAREKALVCSRQLEGLSVEAPGRRGVGWGRCLPSSSPPVVFSAIPTHPLNSPTLPRSPIVLPARQRAGPGAGCVPPDAGRGVHPQPGHLQHPHRRLRQDGGVGGGHQVGGIQKVPRPWRRYGVRQLAAACSLTAG